MEEPVELGFRLVAEHAALDKAEALVTGAGGGVGVAVAGFEADPPVSARARARRWLNRAEATPWRFAGGAVRMDLISP